MVQMFEVECTHLQEELMRVRFAHSQLISDHPKEWGGTDTGPAPGEMILMALASASALAGRKYAAQRNLDISQLGARANMASVQEGLPDEIKDVALPHLTYAERFWRLLEVQGRLSEGERDALLQAMADNGVAKTIRDGLRLDEHVVYHGARGGRAAHGCNQVLKGRVPLAPGERRVAGSAGDWRVSAFAADGRTCLVRAAGSMSVVGSEIADRRGPVPEELLLGGLAACTTIYVARNAMFHGIPLESVSVRVRAEVPQAIEQPITQVEKIAELVGDFTEDERTKLESFAAYCAFGITLKRGTPITDSAMVDQSSSALSAISVTDAFDRAAPVPDDPAFCSDGSCCMPVYTRALS
jgi:uncharacterized OsmC-like protein